MRKFTSRKLAYLIAVVLTGALAGCGDDGKDGADGAPGAPGTPGTPGESWTPPVATSALETNVKVINYTFGEGTISYEFEVTNENGELVNGLKKAEGKVAALTDKGFINNRTESPINGVEDNVHIGGYGGVNMESSRTPDTEGATLTQISDGKYSFVLPLKGVNAGTEGIVWLRVGGHSESGIASSNEIVVNKPEGAFSTTTEACFSCHVDYSTSPNRHSSYVAEGMNGEVTFVEGCMVCHGSVSRTVVNEQGFSVGGYASNTLSKIGHINHQEFETGFSVMNCSSCHSEPTINVNVTGPGCIDCHDTGGIPGDILPGNGADLRKLHEGKTAITSNKAINDSYKVTGTAPAWFPDSGIAGQWCTTLSLFKIDAATGAETLVDLHELFDDTQTVHNPAKPINYVGSYLHGVYNDSVVGRITEAYDYSYDAEGRKTMCYAQSAGHGNPHVVGTTPDLSAWTGAGLMASLRVSFTAKDYTGAESDVVTIHGYTDVASQVDGAVTAYERRHNVDSESCSTCHNSEANFHKNGNFAEGGLGCVACHNNGQDRRAGNSGPGFGPMVHSMHWGVGSKSVDAEGKEVSNAASVIAPETSCVACHADGAMDLNDIPNQFIKARAYGVSNKMASPVTANCYACHTKDSALSHMKSMGGTISDDVPAGWYTLSTQESCAVCHNPGNSAGIEKYHKFTR
ncbi:multiheme c-type cytochrome [Shewanella litorisediminis]|uniref:Cytochrome C n=1 Tax=Shewanella litorisediminis TaxID=1173586 RepID=A0ABX7G1R9_9GAMM|nr:cytochrome C [Shewanella litorisediminis]MCL2918380.1 cytochrome C [Shewanella litorisediminis]QRH01218.1 cytochrome C [Shewanella litorisediminis]